MTKTLEPHLKEAEVKQVVIHLGVAGGRKQYSLETCAYNEASFSIPDNRGEQFQQTCIVEGKKLGHVNKSCLPLPKVKHAMTILKKSELMYPIGLSTDPGRYLCNYIYYASSHCCEGMEVPVAFIHTPTIPVEDIGTGADDICQILRAIKDQVCA